MEKVSHDKARALLKTAGSTIRSLVSENADLKSKVAAHEENERVREIVSMMEEKDLAPDLDFEAKVAAVREAKSLDVAEEAVKLATPQGFRLGETGDLPSGTDSRSMFEAFCLTGDEQN